MMQVSKAEWSAQETQIAQAALIEARAREIDGLVQLIREKASKIDAINDVWRLNDFLSARRFDIDGKYDDSEGETLFVLARLAKEGWVKTEDLEGLDDAKLAKIAALTRIL
ncbi:MAG: hypothetical protein ACFB0G_02955 [Leptolyngbyaceae cyanobacterium]